jgi:Ca2+-binding RTX toxin-like protein
MGGASRFRVIGVCCAAAALLGVGAGPAQAARISTTSDARGGQQVVFEALRGEANRATVRFVDGAYVFEDSGAPIAAGPGCEAAGGGGSCRAPGPAALRVELGDGDDSLQLTGVDPAFGGPGAAGHAMGGPGNDILIGSPVDDRLDGGTGADRIDGGDGRDSSAYPRSEYPRALDDQRPKITLDGLANDGKPGEDDNVASVEQVDTIDRSITGVNGPDTPLVAPPIPDGPAVTDDLLVDTGGSGTVDSGNGDDLIDSTDGQPDTLLCGEGEDVALADLGDQPVDCESTKVTETAEPRLGRQMELKPVRGDLLGFAFGDDGQLVPLREEVALPIDSPVTATGGSVQLTVAATTGTDPRTESAVVGGGSFTVEQSLAPQAAGPGAAGVRSAITTLRLAPVDPANCPASLRLNKFETRVSLRARTQFSVSGQFAVASGRRGAIFRVRETCDITYVYTARGRVTVQNLVTGQRRVVRPRAAYYARRGNR